jgi:hypothetical protein
MEDRALLSGMVHAADLYNTGTPTVTFANPGRDALHVPSEALQVLEQLLAKAGETDGATITSAVRTPRKQAEIMYQEASKKGGVAYSHNLYGSPGDQVIQKYVELNAKGRSKSEIIAGMTKLIKQLANQGTPVSHHIENPHLGRTVIDIDPKSITNWKQFEKVVKADPRVDGSRFYGPKRPGSQTVKKDKAYHIEFKNNLILPPPDATPPPSFDESPPSFDFWDLLASEPNEFLDLFDDLGNYLGDFEFFDDDFSDDPLWGFEAPFYDELGELQGYFEFFDNDGPGPASPEINYEFLNPFPDFSNIYYLFMDWVGGFANPWVSSTPTAIFALPQAGTSSGTGSIPQQGTITAKPKPTTATQPQQQIRYTPCYYYKNGTRGCDEFSFKTYAEAVAKAQRHIAAWHNAFPGDIVRYEVRTDK